MKRHIDIDEPCSENFEEMTPTDRGSFCVKCAIDVYDFRNKSADEIRNVLKLNIGSRVCGRVTSNQLDVLNADFAAWKMNSKRSFQSALVFSLIVTFGMTLFSCEEEEQEKKIGMIQKAGLAYLESPGSESTSELITAVSETTGELAKKKLAIALELKSASMDRFEIAKEQHHYENQTANVSKQAYVKSMEKFNRATVMSQTDGVMRASSDYTRHLKDQMKVVEKSTAFPDLVATVDPLQEFDAFTFPNPAFERTTLRIVMPQKAKVMVEIHTMSGQLIRTISEETLKKGGNNIPINLIDMPTESYIISIRSEIYQKSLLFVKL